VVVVVLRVLLLVETVPLLELLVVLVPPLHETRTTDSAVTKTTRRGRTNQRCLRLKLAIVVPPRKYALMAVLSE